MAQRYTYWTIILADGPTSFRARDRDSLVPTLKQLRSRDPKAVLKWFANGRLWDSPEHALEYTRLARMTWHKTRGPEWRPGGEHRDPRARVKKPKPPKRRSTGPGGAGGSARSDRPASGPSKASRAATPRPRGAQKPGGWKPRDESRNGQQRRPYRPTGGTGRGGRGGGGGRK